MGVGGRFGDERYTVLFICTGNTCRSPMAEKMFEDLIAGSELEGRVDVLSAGLNAPDGGGAAPQAVEVMSERGLDLSAHRTRRLDDELLRRADLILTMTVHHRREVQARLEGLSGGNCGESRAEPEVYTLRELRKKANRSGETLSRLEDRYRRLLKKRDEPAAEQGDGGCEENRPVEPVEESEERRDTPGGKGGRIRDEIEEELSAIRREMDEVERGMFGLDIPDPFGRPVEYYRSCAEDIRDALAGVRRELENRLGGEG